jgi:aminoglycoside 2'-N-acetyltransferase I
VRGLSHSRANVHGAKRIEVLIWHRAGVARPAGKCRFADIEPVRRTSAVRARAKAVERKDMSSTLCAMVALDSASTDTLAPRFLDDIRALLDAAFAGKFTDADWAHAIGGMHVWVIGSAGLISHGSLVERSVVCSGQTLHVGYVEAVATAEAQRRRGYGTMVMTRLGELIRERYELGVLSTGAHGFYEALGWQRWRGPTFVNSPRGLERTPADDGGIMILRTPGSPALDVSGHIACDWRVGDVW